MFNILKIFKKNKQQIIVANYCRNCANKIKDDVFPENPRFYRCKAYRISYTDYKFNLYDYLYADSVRYKKERCEKFVYDYNGDKNESIQTYKKVLCQERKELQCCKKDI